jgi:acyl-CoA reductase-like NAD-dependent aldehyde dehydrogenase
MAERDVLDELREAAGRKWQGDPAAQRAGLFARAATEVEELRRDLAEVEALRAALSVVERRLREDTAPILRCVEAHGDDAAKRAWKGAVYASAVHAQLALTPNVRANRPSGAAQE